MIRFCWNRKYDLNKVHEEYVILDENIWDNARKYFHENKGSSDKVEMLPVLDKDLTFVCYAWNDDTEANKEIRMLRELEDLDEALDFCNLYPQYDGVTIHECNELAWNFANYLKSCGNIVNVEGKLWQKLGSYEKQEIPYGRSYEIWAEGTWTNNDDLLQERIRTVSVEFECVDKIYEANIKAGKITNALGDCQQLLDKLRTEKEIVIRGIRDKAQNAYDWLLANGIDICAFLSVNNRKQFLGKPVLNKSEIEKRFKNAVVIECASKYSAWGFGDVDDYDYEGYKRNERYILLRDYIEVPESNLEHIMQGKKLILTGDISLCNVVYRQYSQYGINIGYIKYLNILEDKEYVDLFNMPVIDEVDKFSDCVCMLVLPQYLPDELVSEYAAGRCGKYIEKLNEQGIYDYTDYFSIPERFSCLDDSHEKYREKLRPKGILLGNIPGYNGSSILRYGFPGHPQVITIEEYSYLDMGLYYICVRLAELMPKDILVQFWKILENEACLDEMDNFPPPKKHLFCKKMDELLSLGEKFTSQELFVMFHIAYKAMYGVNIDNIEDFVIYWEPHLWTSAVMKKMGNWLDSKEISGYMINIVRNRYIKVGSCMNRLKNKMKYVDRCMILTIENSIIKDEIHCKWNECTIKFEDIKLNPREIMTKICNWLGISFDESLMQSSHHGEVYYYEGEITGFDLTPVYNLHEDLLSEFDRMRLCILGGSYQKQYGYPYVCCLDFTRRELQEMFLKNFRWENTADNIEGKNILSVNQVQRFYRSSLWLERFAEIMGEVD